MANTDPSQKRRTDGMVVVTLRSPAVTVKAELASPAMRRALFAEFLGTLLFVVFGAGTAVVTGSLLAEKLTSARVLAIALAHGIAFPLLVLATVRVSGGHLNPAVTFAAMIRRSARSRGACPPARATPRRTKSRYWTDLTRDYMSDRKSMSDWKSRRLPAFH